MAYGNGVKVVPLGSVPFYPRGFDFRPPNVRSFADDLASKAAVQRAADFMRQHTHR